MKAITIMIFAFCAILCAYRAHVADIGPAVLFGFAALLALAHYTGEVVRRP